MPKKILVVDDDPTTNQLVCSLLKSEGYETISAIDGLDALANIQRDCPDLVVLDVMMPELNGYDVCYQLRFTDKFKKIPIILLTQRSKEIDDNISMRTNIEYISKPVDSKILFSKIEKLLESANS